MQHFFFYVYKEKNVFSQQQPVWLATDPPWSHRPLWSEEGQSQDTARPRAPGKCPGTDGTDRREPRQWGHAPVQLPCSAVPARGRVHTLTPEPGHLLDDHANATQPSATRRSRARCHPRPKGSPAVTTACYKEETKAQGVTGSDCGPLWAAEKAGTCPASLRAVWSPWGTAAVKRLCAPMRGNALDYGNGEVFAQSTNHYWTVTM